MKRDRAEEKDEVLFYQGIFEQISERNEQVMSRIIKQNKKTLLPVWRIDCTTQLERSPPTQLRVDPPHQLERNPMPQVV